MFAPTFYHRTLYNYAIMFGSLFNQIYVNRYDVNNTSAQTLLVPLI